MRLKSFAFLSDCVRMQRESWVLGLGVTMWAAKDARSLCDVWDFTSSQCRSFKFALIRSACSSHQSSFKFILMDEEEPCSCHRWSSAFFSGVSGRFGTHGGSRHPHCFHYELSCCDRMLLVICCHGYRPLMPFSDCFCAVQLSNLWRCRSCVGVEPWQWVLRACPLSLTTPL